MKRAPGTLAALLALVACWALLPLSAVFAQAGDPRAELHQLGLPATGQIASGLVTPRLGSSPLKGPETETLDGRPPLAAPTSATQAPPPTAHPCVFLALLAKQPPTLRGPPPSVV